MSTIFKTTVIAIGPEAEGMIEGANMLILFGKGAPSDLAEFCFTINNKELAGTIQTGGTVYIDELAFPITFVGELVEKNLQNLGHITISFDGSTAGTLPGTLHVSAKSLPKLSIGTSVRIVS
ncbi:PTS glucitol/sorbitol transporter subunit IIA [Streptococcus thoraltensis]|uniref:PTS glucitol/sorbitol transporter subunit IIA n=1 Tax=Streptococcus thoraltensis TaxID=55085 RepID=UPI00036D0234|nr:PTS glucitol/sorbitol transporter subunit IIA [Streptococcus thoraltensis]MDY4761634.1 PTS glucitol/sorbitol transporter subunit IIA [Streptococcus thoraltensis]